MSIDDRRHRWGRRLWPAALLAAAAAVAAPDAARRAELEGLLRNDCGACHGGRLHGGLGPALTPAALAGRDPAALAATILAGRPGTPMPPWRGLLSEEDARWLAERLIMGERNDAP